MPSTSSTSSVTTIARAGWIGAPSGEEARAYLQARMSLFAMLVLVSIAIDLVLLNAMYAMYPAIKPANANAISAAGSTALVALALMWRIVIARVKLSIAGLYRMDALIAGGIGAFLAAGAYFAYDLRPASYTAVVLAYSLVFTRALVVPSSGTRTALVTAIIFAPLVVASIGLTRWPQEVPPLAFISGAMVFATVAVVLCATGSRILYGLRQKVSEAQQLGRYTLVRKIGEGGMGAVYRARHELLRRPTAIKMLPPSKIDAETLDRFELEVQHMSELTHPNTVAVYDYGRSADGVFYYAMEYLDGIDLQALVARFGPQPPARVAAILAQVCGALDEAHRKAIVHRDIKPANIILCERGGVLDTAKVVDFGLAQELTAARDDAQRARAIHGTPGYVAPEAMTDPDRLGPPADLYALGAVAYYMLAGKRVFDGKTAVELCVQHVTALPKPIAQVAPGVGAIPAELERLVMACLAKKPDERPTAASLARELRGLQLAGWTDEDAEAWWATFRTTAATSAVTSDAETLTITVDLGQRTPSG